MANTPHRHLAADEPSGKKRKRPRWVSVLKWAGIAILALAVVGTAGVFVAYSSVTLPDPNAEFQTNTSYVYYADNKQQIGTYQVQDRQSIPYDQMSKYVVNGVVAAENRTFWTDPGFSVPSMARAVYAALTGGEVSGASTITQEYIKVLYLTQEKTLSRKFEEILLAAKMGQEEPKEQILGGYLNTVYFGRGAYGIQAAAKAYFNKSQDKLTLGEAVALVSIINNPNRLDPRNGTASADALLGRYQYVLSGMVSMGTITPAQNDAIYDKLPAFPKIPTDSRLGGPKGFVLSAVQNELLKLGFSSEQIQGGGLRIVTTLNAADQAAAVSAVQQTTLDAAGQDAKKAANLHGALVSIDNVTGGVLAFYAGPDYVSSSFNWATIPCPPASTFKPYAVVAALRDGWTLNNTLNGNPFMIDGAMVRNDDRHSYGRISLLKATTLSVNTAFTDLVSQLPDGAQGVAQAALDAGVQKNSTWDLVSSAGARIALGGMVEVSPWDQAAAYSTFANNGLRMTPYLVSSVLDQQGNILYQAQATGTQTIDPGVASNVTYALTKVAQDGTGRVASALPYPVAGKTGTGGVTLPSGKSIVVSGWFVGFTKQITTAVAYVAGNGSGDLNPYAGSGSFYGSDVPTRTWLSYMTTAMTGMEKQTFPPPTAENSTITQAPVPSPTQTPTSTAPPATAAPVVTPTPVAPAPSPTAPAPSEAPPPAPSPQPDANPPPTNAANGADGANLAGAKAGANKAGTNG